MNRYLNEFNLSFINKTDIMIKQCEKTTWDFPVLPYTYDALEPYIDAQTFGSFQDFQTMFTEAATNRFGSGWAWLIVRHDGSLAVTSTPNQDNPLMDVAEVRGVPILALDVWEHAYYLKYQNRRMDYINAFWNIVNWDRVSSGYQKATE